MSRQAWKNKLKEAKKVVKTANQLEDDTFAARIAEAHREGNADLADQIIREQNDAHKERNFKVDGKAAKKDITDPELLQKFKKANVNKRKGRYTWAEGGREAAKDMRRSFEACGRTIAKLRKTCEEVSKRRKKKQRREKRLAGNEANRESSLYWWES